MRTAALLALAGVVRAEEGTAAVRVRVVTFGGEAVAAARLEVRRSVQCDVNPMWPGAGAKSLDAWWKLTRARADSTLVATATTDAAGWAELDGLPAGALDVTAHVAGRAVRGAQVLSPPVRGAPPPTILLDAGYTVAGRVVGQDGSGVAGALVVATFPAAGTARWEPDERPGVAVTDDQGAFRIGGVPDGTVVLRACPPGTWFERRHLVRVPLEAPAEISLPLYALDGVVKDKSTGAPVAGAAVLFATFGFHRSNTLVRGTTDARGRLRLRVPTRWLGKGEIHAPGYLRGLRLGPSTKNPPDLESGRPVEFTAVPAAPVRGTVRDATGPVAGARVTATWLAGFDTKSVSARNRADGTFELGVRPGLNRVVAERPGLAEREDLELDVLLAVGKDGEGGLVRVPAAGRDGLRLELPPPKPAGRITGRVVTARGVPVLARVEIADAGDRRGVRTAADGTFEREGVPAGEAWLSVNPIVGRDVTRHLVRVSAGTTTAGVDIVVPAPPAAWVEGRVVGREDDPPKGTYVVDPWNHSRRHPVARDGSFAFAARSIKNEVRVEVVSPDGRGATVEAACPKGGLANLGDIELWPQRVAVFRVVAAEGGAPVPGAMATSYLPPDAIYCGPSEQPSDLRISRADEAGRIRVPIPRDGDWQVQIGAPGFSSRRIPADHVGGRESLKPLARIAGRLRFAGGRPAAGIRVEVSTALGSGAPYQSRETLTDADGRFRFEGLAAVDYCLSAVSGTRGPSITELHQRDVPAPSESLDLVVQAALTIEGRVVDVRGRPVVDTEVRADKENDEDAATLETRTDKHGAFRLAGAAAGTYVVRVSRDGHRPDGKAAGVAAGTKDLVVRADCGHLITGRLVDGAGRPRPGWVVNAERDEGRISDSRARTDADGRFVLEDLDGGVWNLELGRWGHRKPDSGGEAVPAGTEDVVLVLK